MRSIEQPPRTAGIAVLPERELRPQPWIAFAARRHEPDNSGIDDPSGIQVMVADCENGPRLQALSNLEAIRYAASQVRGGGSLLSTRAEHIGATASHQNQQIYRQRLPVEDITYAAVVTGVAADELSFMLAQMVQETESLARGASGSSHHLKDAILFSR